MDVKKIDEELDKLEESTIEKIDFDLLKHEIVFDLTTYEGNEQVKNKLFFKNVSAFFCLNDLGSDRFRFTPFEPDNRLELTSIAFYPTGLGTISLSNVKASMGTIWFSQDKTASLESQMYSSANFVLEIWSRYLYIEATCIEINNTVYELPRLKD